MNEKQDTKLYIPIKCANCHKTLAYRSTDMTISNGEILIKCRTCKQLRTVIKSNNQAK